MSVGIPSWIEGRAARFGYVLDAAQLEVAEHLEHRPPGENSNLYIWGGVGRGKTWLVDGFYDAANVNKLRMHFHSFFRELHSELQRQRNLGHGFYEALDYLLGETELLVFDEFHAPDPADAAMLARLLERIFERNIRLITTSNYKPEDLLPDPQFHYVAQPAIDAIRSNMTVMRLDGELDYRTASGVRAESVVAREFAGTWVVEPGVPGIWSLQDSWGSASALEIEASGHRFRALEASGNRIVFSYANLLEQPSSAQDYVQWLADYREWMLVDVPPLSLASPASRRRFMNLVDVLCDGGAVLHVRAAVASGRLFDGVDALLDVERTLSRLLLLDVRA